MDSSVLLTYQEGIFVAESNDPIHYALKADSITISISKTPIQIPIPQNTPQLIDFGIFRPAITLSAIIDNVGGNPDYVANLDAEYQGMDKVSVYNALANATYDYYIPYKNKLEEKLYQWVADDENVLTLVIGDTSFPIWKVKEDGVAEAGTLAAATMSTGGGTYQVALQQARFQLDAGREDRWICQMQFVSMSRRDVVPRVF